MLFLFFVSREEFSKSESWWKIMYCVGHRCRTCGRLERRVGFYDCHFQGVTYHQSLLATQMISIYISYELIYACLRPHRTHSLYAVKLSLLSWVSPIFLWALVSVYTGLARVRHVSCVGKLVGCVMRVSDHFNPLANYQGKYSTC